MAKKATADTYWNELRQHMPVPLSRDDIEFCASAGAPWANELVVLFPICDKFYDLLVARENEGKALPCPVCYGPSREHTLERLMRCAPKHYQREECDHDWAYDFMGGDICRKCGRAT